MKSLAVALLAYLLAVHLIAKFSPIPFIGLAAGFIGFPLALRISWKSLFLIEIIGFVFAWAINVDYLMAQYIQGKAVLINFGFGSFLWYYDLMMVVMLPVVAIAGSAICATIMKLLSRFTPKRIRFMVMGNP